MRYIKKLGFARSVTLSLLLFAVMCIVAYRVDVARAATTSSFSFYITASSDNGFTDIDDAYAIITDVTTGDMMSASTGAVDTTWTNCDIAFTKDAQNPYWSGCTIPALDTSKVYAIVVYEDVGGDGSEAATDPVRIDAMLFDPELGQRGGIPTYSDTNPLKNRRVRSINE